MTSSVCGPLSVVSAAIALAMLPGCSRATPSKVLVTVSIEECDVLSVAERSNSQLHPQEGINQLRLTLQGGGYERTLSYALVRPEEPQRLGISVSPSLDADGKARTVTLEVTLGPGASGPLTIEAAALRDGRLVVSQTVRRDFESFLPGQAPEVTLSLRRSCILTECPAEQTCIPDLGCKLLTPPTGEGVAVDAGDIGDPNIPNGPACDCDSYFPFCVGASWKYLVCDKIRNQDCSLATPKVWVVTNATSLQAGSPEPLFMLTRFTHEGKTRKWLTLTGTTLSWLKDESFSVASWKPLGVRYFLPSKLRLDHSHDVRHETWAMPFQEVILEAQDSVASEIFTHDDRWEVITLDDRPDLKDDIVRHGFPRTSLNGLDVLCHHRIDTVKENRDNSREATYCFARYIGKIFESTTGGGSEQEWLLGSHLPAGSKCISVPDTAP